MQAQFGLGKELRGELIFKLTDPAAAAAIKASAPALVAIDTILAAQTAVADDELETEWKAESLLDTADHSKYTTQARPPGESDTVEVSFTCGTTKGGTSAEDMVATVNAVDHATLASTLSSSLTALSLAVDGLEVTGFSAQVGDATVPFIGDNLKAATRTAARTNLFYIALAAVGVFSF